MNPAVLVIGLVVVVSCGQPAVPGRVPPPRPPPTAIEIVKAMTSNYQTAISYSDRGSVALGSASADRRLTAAMSFETTFLRSARFRFELRDEIHPQAGLVIWSDGSHAYSRWYGPPRTTDDGADLGLAITVATKPSRGSAYTIPRLLLPDAVPGLTMTDLTALRIVGTEPIEDHPCWVVTGDHPDGGVTLWIDRASHLLRRTADGNTVTTYTPVLNAALVDSQITPPDFSDDYEHASPLTLRAQTMVNTRAPDFEVSLVGGPTATTLAGLAGRVVVLDFWATWCGPCRKSMPHLDAWEQKLGPRGLRVIGLSTESPDVIRKFNADNPVSYTLAHDDNGVIARRYQVMALPMLVVVDKTGVIRHVALGVGDLDRIEAVIERLLK